MASDMEFLARALLSGTQTGAQVSQLEKLSELFKTPDGQKLLSLLASENTDSIRQAAQAALRGDEEAAKKAIVKLMSTRDGAALIKTLVQSLGKGK